MNELSGYMGFLYIATLASVIGVEIISKVPSLLHTPLMSGSNAISGIIVIGGIAVLGQEPRPIIEWLAYIAVFFAMVNVIGGFVVTHRMLAMFQIKRN